MPAMYSQGGLSFKVIVLVALSSLSSVHGYEFDLFSSQPEHDEVLTESGHAYFWHKLGRISTRDEEQLLPVALEFTSNFDADNKLAGVYWSLPFFESRVYLASENEMVWVTVEGQKRFLSKQKYQENETSKFIDSKWGATRDGRVVHISARSNSYYYLIYRDGLLSEFRFGKASPVFSLSHTHDMLPRVLRLKGSSTSLLSAKFNSRRVVQELLVNGSDKYEFKYKKTADFGQLLEKVLLNDASILELEYQDIESEGQEIPIEIIKKYFPRKTSKSNLGESSLSNLKAYSLGKLLCDLKWRSTDGVATHGNGRMYYCVVESRGAISDLSFLSFENEDSYYFQTSDSRTGWSELIRSDGSEYKIQYISSLGGLGLRPRKQIIKDVNGDTTITQYTYAPDGSILRKSVNGVFQEVLDGGNNVQQLRSWSDYEKYKQLIKKRFIK